MRLVKFKAYGNGTKDLYINPEAVASVLEDKDGDVEVHIIGDHRDDTFLVRGTLHEVVAALESTD
jgi:hypothetical protein